jgi:oligopeptide transport system substrate-binding protein
VKIAGLNSKTLTLAGVCVGVLIISSCTELKRPEPNPYLAETQPPAVKELRWSNGAAPKSLDPALSNTAPETDIVRAIYEGLTVTDPKTLDVAPGVAESWTVSDDGLVWTFKLRDEAKWSNGKAVTANDFVRSWKRLNQMGPRAAHRNLLENIAKAEGGIRSADTKPSQDFEFPQPSESENESGDAAIEPSVTPEPTASVEPTPAKKDEPELDVSAPDAETLVVKLVRADSEFPRVVAHPIFSPIFDDKKIEAEKAKDVETVTNGAMKVESVEGSSIALIRSENYWDGDAVKLDKITFVSSAKPDEALAAYRDGKVDVVTNTEFAPLAQKLFSPYADFKKSAFAALNFYEINSRTAPFNDRRVREALAISLEREKISEVELEGTTLPAFSFLPFANESGTKIVQDKDRAAELLEQAGFPGGVGFPTVRLVINRNDVQQRVARAAARMWKANLNIDTNIIVAENAELEEIRKSGSFDLLRRGVVFPTSSEFVSMSATFGNDAATSPVSSGGIPQGSIAPSADPSPVATPTSDNDGGNTLTEAQAVFEMHAIPIYFPMSFSLVKPYVNGFEINSLDSISVTDISIDSEWRPQMKSTN